jgi:hypothetical protein
MSGHPELEELETLASGQGAAEVEGHVAQCAECERELSWLRAERALMARRPAPPVQQLWAGIEARLAQRPRLHRPRWARRIAVGSAGLAAAAAVILMSMRPKPAPVPGVSAPAPVAQRDNDFRPDPKALAALDRAEADYRDAAKVLEAEYDRLRPHLDPTLAKRWDETLTRAHTELGEARAVAGDDVNARMQVLDGYAGYLRSLRNVVQQSEEANP